MRIELLTIGDELLDGLVADLNTAHIGLKLGERGLSLARRSTLRDDLPALVAELRAIAARADICLTSGGLGPTTDDLTVEALAAAADVALVEDPAVLADIEGFFVGRAMPEINRRQARVPVGGVALRSEVGTAPGVTFTLGRCTFFLMPGVPRELYWHLDRYVLPALEARLKPEERRVGSTLRFVGIGESTLGERVEALALPASVEVAYRTCAPENQVRLRSPNAEDLAVAERLVTGVAPDRFVGRDEVGLPEAVIAALSEQGLTLGTAESCTGGLVGATLTQVPGASAVFWGAVVSYSNEVKRAVLGVPEEILATDGAVSAACAVAMAEGARRVLGTDLAVSITGVAGPGGGSPEKPVGMVCFGYAWEGGSQVETHRFAGRPGLTGQDPGDRERIRRFAVAAALDGVRRLLGERLV